MFGYSDPLWETLGVVCWQKCSQSSDRKEYSSVTARSSHGSPARWTGERCLGQFLGQKSTCNTYPEPGFNGAEIKMLYRHGGSYIFTMTDTNRCVHMYQYPNLEFVVNRDCRWQNEVGFTDIILSARTNFEREDICEFGVPGGYGTNDFGANRRMIISSISASTPCGNPGLTSISTWTLPTTWASKRSLPKAKPRGHG